MECSLANSGWLDNALWLKVGSFCRGSEAVTVDNDMKFASEDREGEKINKLRNRQ
jgi:hypothetical protein